MLAQVSVVIPAYNGADVLSDAIASIAAQTRRPLEVVVVDDASIDTTVKIAVSAGRSLGLSVRVIRLERNSGGPTVPLNTGVEAARGDIVVTLDQDDTMLPRRVAEQVRLLEQAPDCPLSFGLCRHVDAAGRLAERTEVNREQILQVQHRRVDEGGYVLDPSDFYRHLLLQRNLALGASNIAFRKSAWRRVGGFSEQYRVTWDYDFAFRCCTVGPIGFVDEVVQHRRIHGENLSSRGAMTFCEAARCRWQHTHKPLLPIDLTVVRHGLGQIQLGAGYWESRAGNLREALRAYRRALALGAPRGAAVAGMVKSVPRALVAEWLAWISRRKT